MSASDWTQNFPHLPGEWSPRNTAALCTFTRGSNHVAEWVCSKGHTWDASIKSRTVLQSGCPYCSGRVAIPGVTDLASCRPDMASQWSHRNSCPPNEVTVFSNRTAWWRCDEGHEWKQRISARALSRGCPECRRYSASNTALSVETALPHLAEDWDDSNRVPADKHAVTSSVVGWRCHVCHYRWAAKISARASGKSNCPCCTHRVHVPGVNTLDITRPALTQQWAAINHLRMSDVTERSTQVVRWMCPRGHTYSLSVKIKSNHSDDYCPRCASNRVKPGNSLRETHPEIAQMWVSLSEVSDAADDHESPVTVTSRSLRNVEWKCSEGHVWVRSVRDQVARKTCPECRKNDRPNRSKSCRRSLQLTHPELSFQWDSSNTRTPDQVSEKSTYKPLWNLPCGHSLEISVASRVKNPLKCAVCTGKKVVPGITDLATLYPELAAQWHPDNSFQPSDVSRASGRRARWQGDCGHEWVAKIADRTVKGSGCPYCSNNAVLRGFNDLATTHPDLAAQWGAENATGPHEVTAGRNKPAQWNCASGHTWWAPPLWRAYRNSGCPVCSGRSAWPGFNDLESKFPEVAAQWHPSKNEDMAPDQVTHGSRVKVWWLGPCGHEWKSTVLNRRNGSGCPKCHSTVSKAEAQLREFVESVVPDGTEVIGSDRSVLARQELDVYLPSKKIAFEYNGMYWHSTARRNTSKDYHAEKRSEAAAKGIQLIQVWEDDWRDRRPVVEAMIRTKLGTNDVPRHSARTSHVVEVSYAAAAQLLNAHHLQGDARGTFYDGLVTADGELVAVLVTLQCGTDYRIERYATNSIVRGGFGKLLKVLEKRISATGGGRIVTFADLEVSDGKLYETSGFTRDRNIPPDYKYVYKGVRQHKFNFRLARFRDDPKLVFVPGMSESELAEVNGIPRVHDSGKIRFTKDVPA